MRLSLALLALAALSRATSTPLLGTFHAQNAAFVQKLDLATKSNANPHPVLVSTAFGPFSSGSVYVWDQPTSQLGASPVAPMQVSGFLWPNSVVPVPKSVAPNAFLVADGFLVPGKATGGIWIVSAPSGDFGQAKPVKISNDKTGWFYHNATFIDVNGDGRLDVMTARANKGLFSSGGELLWLENPGSVAGAWKEHVVVQGPDVMFQVTEIDNDPSTIDIVAAQFFSKKLSAYFIKKSDITKGQTVDIDTQLGAAYSINVVDLNGDGKKELLVSTHENGDKSAVYAYQIPSDVKNGTWVRHLLADASNFPVTEGGFNQAAPGFSYPVFPQTSTSQELPYILVAGDGSQSAYLMTPKDSNFNYDISTIVKLDGVVGSIGVGDINNDGYNEFFVPNYDKSTVSVYSFNPSARS